MQSFNEFTNMRSYNMLGCSDDEYSLGNPR